MSSIWQNIKETWRELVGMTDQGKLTAVEYEEFCELREADEWVELEPVQADRLQALYRKRGL